MQPYTVQNLKDELSAILHGTELSNVQNLDQLISRAARDLVLDIDLYETKRFTTIGPVYNGVYDYSGISDLKGNTVSDIYPMVNRAPQDWFNQLYNQEFDRTKLWTLQPGFSIKVNANVKTIRVNYPTVNTGIIINNTDTLAGNGVWSTTGIISSLQENNINVAQGGSSLQFNAAEGANPSTGSLINSTMSIVNLTQHLFQSQLFCNIYIPYDPQAISQLQLRWGSSASSYWQNACTTDAFGNPLIAGWNTVKFDWPTASTFGSPNAALVSYLDITYTTTGAQIFGLLFDGVTSQLGVILGIGYFSTCIFQDGTTSVPQNTVTSDSNVVALSLEGINLLLFLCGEYCAQQVQGLEALFYDATYWQGKYAAAKLSYTARYKSDMQKPTTAYYNMPNASYRRFFGPGYNRR